MKGNPPASATRKNTEGWVEKTQSFLVPEGAATIAFMPTLFQVESGIFDLDDISLKPTAEGALQVAAAKAAEEAKYVNVVPETPNLAKWPQELRVEGNKVLTKDGKEIMLKGLNIDSLQWNPKGERVLRNAIVAVEDWKANLLRLPVKEDYWFGREAGQTDGGLAYRTLVDNFITIAANRGAYTMLDLHRFRAPKNEHIEFWKDAATKYKNNPAVIFEVFNEPHGISWEVWQKGGFVADKEKPADEDAFLSPEEKAKNTKGFHSPGVQALINTIRETGAKNIVIAGGLDWSYDLSGIAKGYTLDQKGGNGLMLSTHIYAGKRDWQNKVLVVADKYPIIVSEFGANTKKFEFMPAASQEDAETWVPKIFGFIDKYKLHYTAFSFHPKSGPHLLQDWDYTPTPEWGAFAKRSLAGEKFPDKGMR
jgi:endoglucanase